MRIFRNFKGYRPHAIPSGLEFAAFTQSEEGHDWYSLQDQFQQETLKVVFDEKSKSVLITNQDPSFLFPADGTSIAEIDFVDIKQGVMYVYDEEHNTIVPDVQANRYIEQQRRIAECSGEIDRLRDEVLSGIANEEDTQRFTALVKYRKAVESIDITQSNMAWPDRPN